MGNSRFKFELNIYHEDEEWTPKILLNSKKYTYIVKSSIWEESIMTTTNDEKLFKRIMGMLKIAEDMTIYTEINCKSKELIKTFKEYYKAIITSYINLCNEINDVVIKSKAKILIGNSDFYNKKM